MIAKCYSSLNWTISNVHVVMHFLLSWFFANFLTYLCFNFSPFGHILLIILQEVNGKEVQIQITGFMEKNTGKFMKELWTLLLSAQKNASGVPQQFLDAKEEEILKKKVLLRLNMPFILSQNTCSLYSSGFLKWGFFLVDVLGWNWSDNQWNSEEKG